MANSSEFDKLARNMSIIPEEDTLEENVHFITDEGEVIGKQEPLKLSLTDVEATVTSSNKLGDKNVAQSSTVEAEDLKVAGSNKSVTFVDDSDEFDLYIVEPTPLTLSSNIPVQRIDTSGTNTQNNENMSTDTTAVVAGLTETTSDSSYLTSSVPRPSNLPLPSQTTAVEGLSSASVSTPKDGENTSERRYFEVSNVDEALLTRQLENGTKDKLQNDPESSPENRPLLEKKSSSLSDSEQSTYNAYLDTIGPLENPYFLKMLNYSVSRTVQDDGFRGTSNLDLNNFTSAQALADMDAGWAWVVLFAAFFSLSLTGATTFAAGVLMSAILQIDPDITKASWIGAVHISVLCMSGPFVGIVLKRLGARWTAFFAGIVLAAGLIGASFASSVIELIFTHGLVAGMGSGFILNTMFVTVGQYFNRYRGLACGLLATGSGVGMLAGGNALAALLNHFGLSGTYLLWSGVTLHSLVFAMLLRPPPAERIREAEKTKTKDSTRKRVRGFQGDVGSMRSGTNSVFSGRTSSFRQSQRSTGKASQQDLGVAPLLKTVLHREMSRSSFSVATKGSARIQRSFNLKADSQNKLADKPGVSSSGLNTPSTPIPIPTAGTKSPLASNLFEDRSSPPESIPLLDSSSVSEVPETIVPSSPNSPSSPTFSQAPSEINRSFRRRLISGSSQAPSTYTSMGRLSYRTSIREQLQRNDLDNESLASTLVSHLQPQDALSPRYRLGSRSVSSLFGSISSFPTALVILKDDLSQVDATDGPEKKTIGFCMSFLDSLRLLRNKPFLVFISTCMLWALADSPFSMYLPAYTMSKGSTQAQASSLYTAMGFGSMCGRFLSGLVASDSGVGPVLLHIGCLSITSFVVGFSPWITSTYFEQMICAGLFGLYTGSLVPLSSLITIELLGIGELGLGFGFLSMAQGIGYLAGPPLMGIVIQTVGYEMGFRIAGLILLSGSLLDMTIAVLIRKVDEEDIHDSLEDLERALMKISDTQSVGDNDEAPSTKPMPTVSVKKNEEQSVLLDDTSFVEGGDHMKETKLTPLSEANIDPANDLHIIREEA